MPTSDNPGIRLWPATEMNRYGALFIKTAIVQYRSCRGVLKSITMAVKNVDSYINLDRHCCDTRQPISVPQGSKSYDELFVKIVACGVRFNTNLTGNRLALIDHIAHFYTIIYSIFYVYTDCPYRPGRKGNTHLLPP